ncbi:MAG TPA: ABC transporter permease [Cyclobacteriaceae bacterium]|nr:ABC transporter permease [Cyclobacteriaceae bacterium]HMV89444.1 ABC transporter permease [Cyclobacteriaceae bacterium]HMX02490.1 ABC transporter permease [Cyclobacteriaceae bacterium]HMX52080.1 ABC transporter permease [Cyclobacteriaceae bacterium]HMY91684.1 ABC transporter permease [Cyclobacteriaceae bacterium]
MFKNYLKVAFRNILKYKFFSLINILGMTIGVTACLLIALYVTFETSYDRFHEQAHKIYQVGLHARLGGQDIMTSTTCPPMAEAFVKEIPGVEQSTRIAEVWGSGVVKYEPKNLMFTEEKIFYADSNFFKFFSFHLINGDPEKVLLEPNSVVLTRAMETKYFGTESGIGKLLSIGGHEKTYKVTGITDDCPENSHFRYNMLVSSSSGEHLKSTEWLNNYLHTYLIINENTPISAIENKFPELTGKYVGPEIEKFMGGTLEQMKQQGGDFGYFLTPLTDIHLKSKSRDDLEPGGDITYVYVFTAIGAFIIIIACINFMNLSTARSAGRAKEVGLRKTLGSLRSQMIFQFMAESMIYSLIAVLLAVGLCYLLLPYFNLLSGRQLGMEALTSTAFLLALLGLVVLVGVVAGSYPAFYMTSFNAVEVLKGKVRSGMKSKGIRSGLVVLQFMISIVLIISTAVVYQQLTFMQDRDMGIDKHNVLIIHSATRLGDNINAFKTALESQTGVVAASYTNNSFPGVNNTTVFKAVGSEQDHIMGLYYADYDHQEVMKFELKEGRYFSKDFPSDSMAILLNEAAVKEFGYDNPLQEEVIYSNNGTKERLKVIGVFKDFNFESLKTEVRPLAIRVINKSWQLMVRYEGNAPDAVASIEKLWKVYAPNEPFDYGFLDQNFDELFRSEQRIGQLARVFSGLAIFIASLGLFALAAFTTEQRAKEIGIRKAMGASPAGLVMLLSREFTRLVLIAFIPAAGLAYWAVNEWLNGFAYRISMSPLIFIGSGIAAISVAWITVSYQSIKAAAANPVESLRQE